MTFDKFVEKFNEQYAGGQWLEITEVAKVARVSRARIYAIQDGSNPLPTLELGGVTYYSMQGVADRWPDKPGPRVWILEGPEGFAAWFQDYVRPGLPVVY